MKVGILPIGQVPPDILDWIVQSLPKIFPDTTCSIIDEALPVPAKAFEKNRNQHNSSSILEQIRVFASKQERFHRVLGVIDADIFASGLNFVFGEAFIAGRTGLISVWRLKPDFYSDKPNPALFKGRILKEAVHELGHTLGLQHCRRGSCVMHFSNSIFDTDRKQSLLCSQCYLQGALAISRLG